MKFKSDFLWGAATAAYQVEGAAHADGRGDSVWDVFCGKKGAVLDGSSGENACMQYEHVEEDVEIMAKMGLKAHNIEPFVTLYHWDLSQVLQEKGGWLPYCLPGALSPETWRGSRACANYGLLPLVSYG